MPPRFVVLMPRVEPRREWERLKKANGRNIGPLGEPFAKCASCDVGIGVHYVAREVYLLPRARVRKRRPVALTWQKVCGVCATEEFGLSYGYCLVAEHDWNSYSEEEIAFLEQQKLGQLQEFLLGQWPSDQSDTTVLNETLWALVPPLTSTRVLAA